MSLTYHCGRQSHYTFTVYPDASFFSEVLELWTEFCVSMAHIDGFNGLHTIMPITPRAIAEGVRRGNNALGVNLAKPNTTLSGKIYSFLHKISRHMLITA
jgi:hypothetical protein